MQLQRSCEQRAWISQFCKDAFCSMCHKELCCLAPRSVQWSTFYHILPSSPNNLAMKWFRISILITITKRDKYSTNRRVKSASCTHFSQWKLFCSKRLRYLCTLLWDYLCRPRDGAKIIDADFPLYCTFFPHTHRKRQPLYGSDFTLLG